MKRISFTLVAATAVLLIAGSEPVHADEVLKPVEQWTGRARSNDGKELAPKNSALVSQEAFAKVWNAWNGDEKQPKIDFSQHLVLVGLVNGPNRVFMSARLGDDGDVKMLVGGTKIGGPGFGWVLAQVKKDGIKSVNGKEVKQGDGGGEGPAEDGVTVTAVGKLMHPVFAIGGETTGTIISAGNIAFELDLGGNKELIKLAEQLNEKKAVATGKLERKKGVEIRDRWIVHVKTLKAQ